MNSTRTPYLVSALLLAAVATVAATVLAVVLTGVYVYVQRGGIT